MHSGVIDKSIIIQQDEYSKYLDMLKVYIKGFGKGICTETGSLEEQMPTTFILIYVVKGTLKTKYRDITITVNENSVFLQEPLTVYKSEILGETPLEYYYISFDVEPFFRSDQIISFLTNGGYSLWGGESLERILPLFEFTYDKLIRSKDTKCLCTQVKSLLYFVVAELLNISHLEDEPGFTFSDTYSKDMEIVKEFTKLISNNISSHLKIADICEEMKISESYLYKVFKKVMKMAPVKYLALYKIDRAKKLLKSNMYSVTEISNMLGYSSVFHFSTSFKAASGITPSQFIKL